MHNVCHPLPCEACSAISNRENRPSQTCQYPVKIAHARLPVLPAPLGRDERRTRRTVRRRQPRRRTPAGGGNPTPCATPPAPEPRLPSCRLRRRPRFIMATGRGSERAVLEMEVAYNSGRSGAGCQRILGEKNTF